MLDLEKIKENYTDEKVVHIGEADTLIQAIMYDIPDLLAEVERLRSALSQCRVALGQLQEAISGTIGDDGD